MGLNCSIPCGCDQYVNKVFQWLHEKGGYIHNLKKNLSALTKTMEELKAKRDDLSKKLKREEDKGRQKVAQLDLWLNNVKAIEKEVNALLTARNDELQRLCLCEFCSKSLPSSYRYGKSVVLRLREVEKLKKEVFEVLTLEAPTPKVRERPLQPTIVGQEEMLNAAWKDLLEEGTGIMGMYGMGGVGKTTLLTQLNNKFSKEKCEFVVIWILVSREFQIEKIQDAIAHQVRLQWNQEEKMTRLFNHLRQTRFVLLLDDIWEKVELSEIGIPNPTPENRCKVVFTTRNQDVCASMAVNKSMEVKCLAEKDAFVLFEKKVGQETLGSHPEIPDLAKKIAEKCHGLPLVLNMIGETMRSRHQVREWENAIKDLNSNAAKFYDKENKILRLLKYSYDSLKEKDAKLCLQYCALFPKDEKAKKTKLIEYWICEEIIDGSEGIERAEDKGYDIIGSLVRTSLLMNADQQGQELVMMHDVIRKMVLWIVHTELGIQEEAFIVGAGLSGFPKVKNWSVVRRMALMDKKIHHLVGSPKCMELTTLLLQNTWLDNISSEFFKYMPKLVVLDLSDNSFLSELPEEISQLVSLQYLNLANAAICHFPKGVLELKKLIHLDLEGTWSLSSITGISRLQNLKVLKLLYTSFPWDLETMKELGSLKHLEILTTTINPGGEQFLCSDRLMSCTRFLDISGVESSLNRYLESSGISLPVSMDKLRCFSIKFCSISEIKMGNRCSFSSLVEVLIQGCEGLRELTFLMFAPSLRILNVQDAKDLEDIIKTKACEGEESGILPKLNDLSLRNLPKLTNIYWNPLLFPCLEKIYVGMCSNLKKLPLDSKSGRVGCKICYKSSGWINSVEWEDKATRDRFLRSSIKAAYSPS